MKEKYADLFSPMEIDAIGEILNISLGSSATAISDLLSKRVNITTPLVDVLSIDEFEFGSLEPAIGVEITYVQGLEGNNIMLLKRLDIKKILEILMGSEIPDEEFVLDEISISAVCEVMNQMMGASATALADFLGSPVNISTPITFEVDNAQDFKNKYFSADEPMVVVSFRLEIEDTLNSEFVTLMAIDLAKRLIGNFSLFGGESVAVETTPVQESIPAPPPVAAPIPPAPAPAPTPAPQMTQAPVSAPAPQISTPAFAEPRVINTQPVQNEYFGSGPRPQVSISEEQSANLDLIMSVPLQLSVEIGRTKKQVKEILDFNQGTLVVLDKLAGDQVDVYVNGQCIAKGDVVVVDDSFGVRITEIIKKADFNFQK